MNSRQGMRPFLTCKRAEGEIKETYPILFDSCPLIMRTEGILLVRDATLLLRFHASSGEFDRFVRSKCTDALFQRGKWTEKLVAG